MKGPLSITVKEYLKENKKLSDFRIVEKIGEGAFGKVYLAIHTENQKVSLLEFSPLVMSLCY